MEARPHNTNRYQQSMRGEHHWPLAPSFDCHYEQERLDIRIWSYGDRAVSRATPTEYRQN